jgi:type I restriction enzyme S subunit
MDMLRKILVPLPPINEQHRIVARIEELFSRLDAGVEALHKAKAQLRRYRQAVLKAAVEGRLTEEWRKAHPEVEPAEELLEKISKERRIEAKKDQNELHLPDIIDLPRLPHGWIWSTLSQIGELNRGISKHRPRDDPKLYGGPYPFIQTGDVRHATGTLKSYSQTYSEEGLKQSRLWPKGTLLITIAANIADTAMLGFDACFPDSIVGFLTGLEKCNIYFVELFIRTAKENIERYAPATAQKNINLRILSELAIPFPPLKEQDAIVNKTEYFLSIADDTEKIMEQSLKRSNRLRQSILKLAFEGKLVPQAPNDEPASVLLERIKAERSKESPRRGRKSGNNTHQMRLIQ